MLDRNDIQTIKDFTEEFFTKMTLPAIRIDAVLASQKIDLEAKDIFSDNADDAEKENNVMDLSVRLDEPQILIGQGGQTLFEIQRLLKVIFSKKLQKTFYLNLDINDYKKKKVEYLKDLAKDLADEVAFTKKERILNPMSPYERRIIHMELKNRTDVATESRGQGQDRHLVIKPT